MANPPMASSQLSYLQPVGYDRNFIAPVQGQEPYGTSNPGSQPRPDPSLPPLNDSFGVYPSHSVRIHGLSAVSAKRYL
jgi:hypothetical protein